MHIFASPQSCSGDRQGVKGLASCHRAPLAECFHPPEVPITYDLNYSDTIQDPIVEDETQRDRLRDSPYLLWLALEHHI
jgi:hypothetical protein